MGITVGSHVAFVFEGRQQIGPVNRITKHATVLVAGSEGRMYSDGLRYKSHYVPLRELAIIKPSSLGLRP